MTPMNKTSRGVSHTLNSCKLFLTFVYQDWATISIAKTLKLF